MRAQRIRPYVVTCGLLLVPALAWNAALLERLPPAISNPDIWGAIPQPLAIAENTLRIMVFAVPFLMPLHVSTRRQRAGIALFIVGTLVYFASWLALIASPHSSWATSAAGFLAPAYTPALWLLGLALLAHEFSWGGAFRPWMYGTLSVLFLAAHISHATIVYVHNYRGTGAIPLAQAERQRQALADFIAAAHQAFPDRRVEVDQVIADGAMFAIRWHGRATHRCVLHGLSPTGRAVIVTGINICAIAGTRTDADVGRISEGK